MAAQTIPPARSASNVVALPRSAAGRIHQPQGGAAGAYRKANPWPGSAQPQMQAGRDAFDWARHELEIARARYQLASAVAGRGIQFGPSNLAQAYRDEAWAHFEAWRAAALALAETPAIDRHQLRAKIAAIGRIWLSAEGQPYASYRAAIERDAARLGVESPIARLGGGQRASR